MQRPTSIVTLSSLYLLSVQQVAEVAQGIAGATRRGETGGWDVTVRVWSKRVISASLSGFLLYSVYCRLNKRDFDLPTGPKECETVVRFALEIGGLCALPYCIRQFSSALYPELTKASSDAPAPTTPEIALTALPNEVLYEITRFMGCVGAEKLLPTSNRLFLLLKRRLHSQVLQAIDAVKTAVEEKLGAMEEKLDSLKVDLDAVKTRLDAVEARLGTMQL